MPYTQLMTEGVSQGLQPMLTSKEAENISKIYRGVRKMAMEDHSEEINGQGAQELRLLILSLESN